jgi:UDP-2,3-diacylglucosamine pyrophosphatase LpxH
VRIVKVEEKLPGLGKLRFHHLSDLHVGAPDFDERAFLERRALIEGDEWARWGMGGDGGDLIRHNDRRYQPTELHPRYRQAADLRHASREHLRELFKPIASKCWYWADGNHERKLDEYFGGKFGVEVCCDLGIESKYVGYRGFVHVVFQIGKSDKKRIGQLIDVQHGWQTGRLKGAFLVQAERELGATDADIVVRGHNHQPAAHTFVTLGITHSGVGPSKLRQRKRTVLNGGTWRRGYRDDLAPIDADRISEVEGDMWGETKGFRSEPLGGPVLLLRVDGGRGGAHPSSAHIEHTILEGDITADTLGL